MKTSVRILLAVLILIIGFLLPAVAVTAQEPEPTLTASPLPSNTLQPTETPRPESPERPLVMIKSYYLNKDTIRPGDSFSLSLSIKNEGGETAHNLIFGFTSEDFMPRETGGVIAIGELGAGQRRDVEQPLLVNNALWGRTNGTISVRLSYTGPTGEAFTETFTITLDVLGWSGTWATATPTPSMTTLPRAQIVVSSYQSDLDLLEPGSIFNLNLEVRNLGSSDAQEVTMVIGGGVTGSIGGEGTPQPGGISGGGSDLSVFAPLGSSNLQYLDDIIAGGVLSVSQKLIVNVSANPGAYTLKVSFVYSDAKGNRLVDDQIITLLVYQLPRVEVNFYRDPGAISAMQPNNLPIQVVNLGRKSAVMGNMSVSAENAELMNNVSLVGTLDAGGYFPLDVMFIPQVAGPHELKITIHYTDDFNESRSIEQTLKIEVIENMSPDFMEPGMEIGPDGMPLGPGGKPFMEASEPETFWQKAIRFLKGLVGLDSAPPQEQQPPSPPEEFFPPGGRGAAPAAWTDQG